MESSQDREKNEQNYREGKGNTVRKRQKASGNQTHPTHESCDSEYFQARDETMLTELEKRDFVF